MYKKNNFWSTKTFGMLRSRLNQNHVPGKKILYTFLSKFVIHLFLIICLAWLPSLILVPLISFSLWTLLNMSTKFFMIICPDWLIHLINAVAMIENEAELAYSNWMPRPLQYFTDEGVELWRTAVVWLTSWDKRTRIHILTQPPMAERSECVLTLKGWK